MKRDLFEPGAVAVSGIWLDQTDAMRPAKTSTVSRRVLSEVGYTMTYRKSGCVALSVYIDGTEVSSRILEIEPSQVGKITYGVFLYPDSLRTPGQHTVHIASGRCYKTWFGLSKRFIIDSLSDAYTLVIRE